MPKSKRPDPEKIAMLRMKLQSIYTDSQRQGVSLKTALETARDNPKVENLHSPLGSFTVASGFGDCLGWDHAITPKSLTAIRACAREFENHGERHVRHIANTVLIAIEELLDAFEKGWTEHAASSAFLIGMYYGRLLLVPNEKDAADGQAAAAGRSKRGKRPKKDSVREWAEKSVGSDWRSKSDTWLARNAKGSFPDRDFDNLRRSFAKAKKVGP